MPIGIQDLNEQATYLRVGRQRERSGLACHNVPPLCAHLQGTVSFGLEGLINGRVNRAIGPCLKPTLYKGAPRSDQKVTMGKVEQLLEHQVRDREIVPVSQIQEQVRHCSGVIRRLQHLASVPSTCVTLVSRLCGLVKSSLDSIWLEQIKNNILAPTPMYPFDVEFPGIPLDPQPMLPCLFGTGQRC